MKICVNNLWKMNKILNCKDFSLIEIYYYSYGLVFVLFNFEIEILTKVVK